RPGKPPENPILGARIDPHSSQQVPSVVGKLISAWSQAPLISLRAFRPAVKGGMRKILVAIIFAGLPTLSALADPPARQRPGNQAAGNFLPTKGPGASNACAAFGPGFAKVEGTDTCV